MDDTPDFPFVEWHFSNTTDEDYNWLVDCLYGEGKDIYVADFSEQGAYSCRILVPGFSEIYPVEDHPAKLKRWTHTPLLFPAQATTPPKPPRSAWH